MDVSRHLLTVLAISARSTVMVLPTTWGTATASIPDTELLGLQLDPDAPLATLGPPIGRDTARSGLRKGDRLVAVDGRPVATTRPHCSASSAAPPARR